MTKSKLMNVVAVKIKIAPSLHVLDPWPARLLQHIQARRGHGLVKKAGSIPVQKLFRFGLELGLMPPLALGSEIDIAFDTQAFVEREFWRNPGHESNLCVGARDVPARSMWKLPRTRFGPGRPALRQEILKKHSADGRRRLRRRRKALGESFAICKVMASLSRGRARRRRVRAECLQHRPADPAAWGFQSERPG